MKINLFIWDFNASAKTIFLKFGDEVATIVSIHSFHFLEYLLSLDW